MRLSPALSMLALFAALALQPHPTRACDDIIVDGRFEDWQNVAPILTDPSGDHAGSAVDFQRVWITNDDTFLYIRVEIGTVRNIQTVEGRVRFFFDLDRNPGTGWSINGIGSDFAILYPERAAVKQAAGTFYVSGIDHADISLESGPTVGSDQFEFRIARDAVFPDSGQPIFAQESFDILLEGWTIGEQNDECNYAAGSPIEYAPDSGAATYTFQTCQPRDTGFDPIEKADSRYIRFVSYNVLWDGLFSRPDPFRRQLQAIDPDIVCFQEIGSHNATETAAQLNQWLPLSTGSWYAYMSSDNVLCSKWPLSLQRGETVPSGEDGQAMALVNLPDDTYACDLYVINGHYKCCGCMGSSEDARRQKRADANIAWLSDARSPGGWITLPQNTPFLLCGDWNMVGGPQPLDTQITGNIIDESSFGTDSLPDWDGTALTDALPKHLGNRFAYTWRSDSGSFPPGRLDFILYADSVMEARRSFVLWTPDLPGEFLSQHGLLASDTTDASDHAPLVVDFALALTPGDGDINDDGETNALDISAFVDVLLGLDDDDTHVQAADMNADYLTDGNDLPLFASVLIGG